MTGARRFSQAIAEGDGISLVAFVDDVDAARAADEQGAEGLCVESTVPGLREASELPVLWRGLGPLSEADRAGADACVIVAAADGDEPGRLEQLDAEARDLGLECVVEVRNDEELRDALERLDPEVFLLAPARGGSGTIETVLGLLPDVPAGKLAVAEVRATTRDAVAELERAGVDAVIVAARDVGELVEAPPPHVLGS